jgi:hypothetical protein
VINDLGLYNSAFNNNSTVAQKSSDEIQALTEKYSEKSVKIEGADNTVDNLFLSSKAQKISAISSEFFSGAELTFDDIGKLKEKLYQFGLISKGDYASLSSDIVNDSVSEKNETVSTTTLSSFIGDFVERLNKEDDNEKPEGDDEINESESIVALTAVLNTAKDIFANIEEQKNKADFKSSLQESLALLKETISDKSFSGLPLDDQIGLSKVYQALEIVDNLSPQRLNNDKVNKYIELSFS